MAADSEAVGSTGATAPKQSLALYRKYRPATFAEVRGQEHVTEPLRQALRSGRINHAYLFSGPRGCGKTSSARILARSLNCVNGPTPDPCGVCDSCVALAPSGPGSIDVIEIDAASHGGVDDARDLRERAFYAPVAGRYKIYIIDEAHMVTQQGFNALLKLVEEPPPHLKFIFATTEPEKVIPTIRSRTHHYPFRLMPPSVMRDLTEEILNSEHVPFDPAVLPLVVRAGGGSARDTLSILDQLLAGSDEEGIKYDRAVALLGYTDASLLDEIVDAFAARDGAAVFHAVNRVIEGGHEPRRFATDMRAETVVVHPMRHVDIDIVNRHGITFFQQGPRIQPRAFGQAELAADMGKYVHAGSAGTGVLARCRDRIGRPVHASPVRGPLELELFAGARRQRLRGPATQHFGKAAIEDSEPRLSAYPCRQVQECNAGSPPLLVHGAHLLWSVRDAFRPASPQSARCIAGSNVPRHRPARREGPPHPPPPPTTAPARR